MFKILQARLQQYVNRELPDVQAGFRKGRGTRDQIANIHWIVEKARRVPEKYLLQLYRLHQSLWCVDHYKLWKIFQEMGIPDHLTCILEACMQVKNQWLEQGMEQWTGSKLGKEYFKAVYCQPAYLTYTQSTLWEIISRGKGFHTERRKRKKVSKKRKFLWDRLCCSFSIYQELF